MFDRNIAGDVDLAIAEVGRAEFDRLSDGLDNAQVRNKITYALDQLSRLAGNSTFVTGSGGRMLPIPSIPDYVSDDPTNDQWLSLFYMLWYQPRQVLLARDVFAELLDSELTTGLSESRRSIGVFDYGCGSLAGLFGLTIALYERQKVDGLFDSITVNNHDVSDPMVHLGTRLWLRFQERIRSRDTLKGLADLATRIRVTSDGLQGVVPHPQYLDANQRSQDRLRFITAFHCVYSENIREVSIDLASLLKRIDPDAVVLSAADSALNYRLLLDSLPGRPISIRHWNPHYLTDNDYVRNVTGLRRWIRLNFLDVERRNRDERYLNQRVRWSYDAVYVRFV